MRSILTLLLVVIAQLVMARHMFVVVYATDMVLTDYVCENGEARIGMDLPPSRRVVQRSPVVNWHVVGGVAPYTLLSKETDRVGNVTVTVADATGYVTSGYSIVRTIRNVVIVDCPCAPPDPVVRLIKAGTPVFKSKEVVCHASRIASARDPKVVRREPQERGVSEPKFTRDGTTRGPKPGGTVVREVGTRGPVPMPPTSSGTRSSGTR